jgi:hypothetical protein
VSLLIFDPASETDAAGEPRFDGLRDGPRDGGSTREVGVEREIEGEARRWAGFGVACDRDVRSD